MVRLSKGAMGVLCLIAAGAPLFSYSHTIDAMGFNMPVTDTVFHAHEQPYLQNVGLDILDTKRITVSGNDLGTLVSHIFDVNPLGSPNASNALDSSYFSRRPIQSVIFYSHTLNAGYDLLEEDIEGFSIIYVDQSTLNHALFEKSGDAFVKVPEYQLRLTGFLTLDEIRLIHFSFAPSSDLLPPSSEIFVVVNETDLLPAVNAADSDLEIARQLFTDSSRNAGRFLSTYYMGYNLRLENTPPGSCASHPGCPQDPSKPSCNFLNLTCNQGGGGSGGNEGEGTTDIEVAARNNELSDDLPMVMDRFYFLRDNVLNTSVKGKQYIRDYYKLGSYVKKDIGMLWKYVDLMPGIYGAIDVFETGSATDIVLNSAVADKILGVVYSHRSVSNTEFQDLLDRIVADVALFRGKTRDQVLQILSEAK